MKTLLIAGLLSFGLHAEEITVVEAEAPALCVALEEGTAFDLAAEMACLTAAGFLCVTDEETMITTCTHEDTTVHLLNAEGYILSAMEEEATE